MNLRDPKNQIAIFVVLLFIVIYYLWFTEIYTSHQDEIEGLNITRSTLLSKLHAVIAKAETLEELEKEYNELQLRYKKVEILLPEKKEDEAFLGQIHAAAQLTNSMVRKITPLGTQVSDFYDTNSYAVEVESSYHGLGRFFAKVANFPFIVNLSDLELKSPTGAGGASGTMLRAPSKIEPDKAVVATFRLSTYNVKQGVSG